ncbi:DUF4974 domain-containing protein [Mucilaginibacter pallidiroseus]|uniref:DUF4974 domain-containing protein n=1 Tax=Mucilaginibacter pallidiroseus TaxID=2599295 RepID=A0A563UCZ3_9SPHI|nr:FecR domain-containing protein [Mucilaginibacter pallidiroseus]TWR29186.1 DUF4974 domain-containing protein [Mucilaginibacter pallidiroseus]
MDSKQRKSYLLNQYINNKCTKEEFAEFLEEVKSSKNFDDFNGAMQEQWEQASNKHHQNANWDTMHNNIVLRLWAQKKSKLRLKYAAVIAFVACASAFFFNHKADIQAEINYVSQKTAAAQTRVIHLADGSTITLNANSTLRYPENFNAKKREVYLTGEAYFEVAHNAAKPFVVHSGKLTTNVLGTSFTVSAYAKNQAMNVTVLTGKVAVKNEESKALEVLTRGHWATVKPGRQSFDTGMLANPEDAIAWRDNKLIFDNANLNDVATKLSNRFGVNIQIDSEKLSNQRITGIFQGRSLPDILGALTKLTHSQYKVQQNTYIIKY